jgi:hypothetical protein
MKFLINKQVQGIRLFGILFLIHSSVLDMRCQDIAEPKASLPPFAVKGDVSWGGFQAYETNVVAVSKTEGAFLFSFRSNIWDIQFTYQSGANVAGTTIDCRRIPGGIREIISYSTNALHLKQNIPNLRPSASAKTNTYPEWERQEIFLPWLSLCPNAELPLISSNLMRAYFDYELLNDPHNEGRFTLSYIEPQKLFLSELIVTNNGLLFLSDGSVMKLSNPYDNGYPQFLFKVLETTNCGGIVFPLNTVLYQFVPSPNDKSPGELYAAVVSRLHIAQIDVGGQHLVLNRPPTNLVALDSRPTGLKKDMTVNYNVINDQWLPLTNHRLEVLADSVRGTLPRPVEDAGYAGRRAFIFITLVTLTLVPLIAFACRIKNKLKGK